MAEIKRLHETKISIRIDAEDGAQEIVVDLETLTTSELYSLVFELPQATDELYYRTLTGILDEDTER
jgi:hypothetical protein